MIRIDIFFILGGLDEQSFPIDLDEADFCRRAKDLDYVVAMSMFSLCEHESQTYSRIPNFRRPLNAFYMGRNKILFQRKHCHPVEYLIYMTFFMPLTVLGYVACLLYRRKPWMIYHFLKGVIHGIQGRTKNIYKFQKMHEAR